VAATATAAPPSSTAAVAAITSFLLKRDFMAFLCDRGMCCQVKRVLLFAS
jgi:hypothetical protein